MKKDDLAILKLSELKSDSEYMIKNFIASNNDTDPLEKYISFDHPCSFDGIVFAICIRGRGKMKINLKEYEIHENSIVTVLPGSFIDSLEQSDDMLVEVLAFTDEFITDMPIPKNITIFRDITLNAVLQLEEEDIKNLLHYHSFILETFKTRKESPFLPELIKGLLYSLTIELATLYSEAPQLNKAASGRSEELVERFFSILIKEFRVERTASYYADKLFVTPKHLSHVLKEVTGKTINLWIDEAVILGAKSLLKSTNDTVLQISEALNFPTASYFGRYFRRLTGMTPLEYREAK